MFDKMSKDMRFRFKSNTILGTWSVRLIVVSLLFFILFFSLVVLGQRGGDTFFSNPVLTVPILLAGIFAVSAFFTGIIGITRSGERSVLVFLATAMGLFVLLFGIAEIISPH